MNFDKHLAIVKRAEDMRISASDRLTALMDIDFADKTFNLRLDDFIKASNPDFIHDFCEIQRHINRSSKTFENCFIPRFAGNLEG